MPAAGWGQILALSMLKVLFVLRSGLWEEKCFGQLGGEYLHREVVSLDWVHVEKTQDLGLHGVLRGFSGPVARNTGCSR